MSVDILFSTLKLLISQLKSSTDWLTLTIFENSFEHKMKIIKYNLQCTKRTYHLPYIGVDILKNGSLNSVTLEVSMSCLSLLHDSWTITNKLLKFNFFCHEAIPPTCIFQKLKDYYLISCKTVHYCIY